MGTWDVWVFDKLGIAGVIKTSIQFAALGSDEVFCGMSALQSAMVFFSIAFPLTTPIVEVCFAGTKSQAKPCNTEKVRRTPEFLLWGLSPMVK